MTSRITEFYGHIFLPFQSCNTRDLISSANSITAGRSTVLTEACLLDKNVGAFLPEIENEELEAFPPITAGAIPYTLSWGEIENVFREITSENPQTLNNLAEKRKRFSTDGMASQRLVRLIEDNLPGQ